MKSRWIFYKGKQIFLIDFSYLDYESLRAEMVDLAQFVMLFPLHSLPTITDVRGIVSTPEILELFKFSGAQMGKHLGFQAVVGIDGVRVIFLDVINRITGGNARPFETLEQAKEWLADSIERQCFKSLESRKSYPYRPANNSRSSDL